MKVCLFTNNGRFILFTNKQKFALFTEITYLLARLCLDTRGGQVGSLWFLFSKWHTCWQLWSVQVTHPNIFKHLDTLWQVKQPLMYLLGICSIIVGRAWASSTLLVHGIQTTHDEQQCLSVRAATCAWATVQTQIMSWVSFMHDNQPPCLTAPSQSAMIYRVQVACRI